MAEKAGTEYRVVKSSMAGGWIVLRVDAYHGLKPTVCVHPRVFSIRAKAREFVESCATKS